MSDPKLQNVCLGELFRAMHHPNSALRQLADWKNGDPQNPPPAVRSDIARLREVSRKASADLPASTSKHESNS